MLSMEHETDRVVPSKRLRNWHRRSKTDTSLKAYVRLLASGRETGSDVPRDRAIARAWLASKGIVL
jgi:hypothetical protein